jgi:hypothetical protein
MDGRGDAGASTSTDLAEPRRRAEGRCSGAAAIGCRVGAAAHRQMRYSYSSQSSCRSGTPTERP